MLMEMRPDTLAEASLPTLLEQLSAAAGGSSRVDVHLDVRQGEKLPQDVSVALFRIAQESLQNVSRHSGASEAWVMLDMSGPVVRLSVRDDGHGFDEAAVTPEHFGLAMMRERAADAGVAVLVESRPGERDHRVGRVAARRCSGMNEGGQVPDGGGEKQIKVIIVDDHVLVRSGLEVVLGMFDDIALVGQAGDGEEAVRLCGELRPDVVLMDLVMPGMSGVEATRRILDAYPETRVVALTSFTEDDLIGDTLRAGAIGYLMKNVSADQLADAVRAAAEGRSTLAPEAADVLMRSVSDAAAAGGLAHGARAGGAQAHGRRAHQRRHRRAPRDRRGHRQDAREQHHRQARRVHAHGGHGSGHPPRPRLSARRRPTVRVCHRQAVSILSTEMYSARRKIELRSSFRSMWVEAGTGSIDGWKQSRSTCQEAW